MSVAVSHCGSCINISTFSQPTSQVIVSKNVYYVLSIVGFHSFQSNGDRAKGQEKEYVTPGAKFRCSRRLLSEYILLLLFIVLLIIKMGLKENVKKAKGMYGTPTRRNYYIKFQKPVQRKHFKRVLGSCLNVLFLLFPTFTFYGYESRLCYGSRRNK